MSLKLSELQGINNWIWIFFRKLIDVDIVPPGNSLFIILLFSIQKSIAKEGSDLQNLKFGIFLSLAICVHVLLACVQKVK